jgi:glycoprotein endo-alpha-1,2-mannosidase
MFEWVLKESESGWWSTECGSSRHSANRCGLGLAGADDSSVLDSKHNDADTINNGNISNFVKKQNSLLQDPEMGRRTMTDNHGARNVATGPNAARTTPRMRGGVARTTPSRIDMASMIHTACNSFDDICESLSGNDPTQQRQQQVQHQTLPPPSKRVSTLSIHTDGCSSMNSEEDAAVSTIKDRDAFDRRRRRQCYGILGCLGLLAILGMGIGIGMSSNGKDKSSSSSLTSDVNSDANSQVPPSSESNNDDGFPDSVGTQSPEEEDGSDSVGTVDDDTDDMPSLTPPPGDDLSTSSPTFIDLDELAASATNRYDYTANTDYLIGVYYYPWHGDNFHNRDGYLRKELTPQQQPALGEYDDSRPEVIKQHLAWSRMANIGLWVTSWWGPDRLEDTNTRDVILTHEDLGNLKIALHYETTGRINGSDMSTPRSDIQHMCEHYFDHPNYYKIDGRPVLVIYVTRSLHSDGILEEALLTMRSEGSKCGHNLYLIGDQVFATAPSEDEPFVPFWYFDAVTNYDVYGSSGQPSGHAGPERVDNYYLEQEKWRQQAVAENCRYIPPVSPGYNDRAVRLESDHPPLSRQLTADSEEGSLFWYQLKQALLLVDPEVDSMILVNSFNEWHEDTQIEPAIGDPATEPALLTGNLTYVGYGELYLNILAAATTRGQDSTVFDYLFEG